LPDTRSRTLEQEAPEVTKADVLERAADLLGEFGWCQGGGWTHLNKFCLLTAIEQGAVDLGYEFPGGPDDHAAAAALLGSDCYSELPAWNDARGRQKHEVVARLREAVRRERGES